VTQTLLHCGTGEGLGDGVGDGDGVGLGLGVGLGDGVGVAIVNVKLQAIGEGVSSAAWGLLSGTLGATATCRS
jgi:hypothetical protein